MGCCSAVQCPIAGRSVNQPAPRNPLCFRGFSQVRRAEPQPHHLCREWHDAVLGRRVPAGPERPARTADASFTNPTSLTSPSWLVLLRRTITSTPVTVRDLGPSAARSPRSGAYPQ